MVGSESNVSVEVSPDEVVVVATRMPVLELKLYICNNSNSEEFKRIYKDHIKKHNSKLDQFHGDSGFDLLNPEFYRFYENKRSSVKYPLGVKLALTQCAVQEVEERKILRVQPQGFMLVPRSSTGSKTNIRLSNSVGIIDSGYRGELCALLDIINFEQVQDDSERISLEKDNRNFQIVSFSGFPIHVTLVEKEEDLGNTQRGTGGFGSTGS